MSSTNNYKISLVAPIYGVEPYIGKFAESLFKQTYNDIEFVFVNDGTKDASMEVLEQLIEEKYEHLRNRIVIVNKENEGLPKARKTGIENATGEYVLLVDSDDWLEHTAAEKLMAEADRTHADLIYCDFIKEYSHRKSTKHEREYTAETKHRYIANLFNLRAYGYTWNKCFRRSLYTDNTIFTPLYGMHEDICLMSQIIFYAKSIVHLSEVLYHYRLDNPNSISVQNIHTRHLASIRNMLDLCHSYKDSHTISPVTYVAGGVYIRAGWYAIVHGYNLWQEYRWLGEEIKKAQYSTRYRSSLLTQLIVKAYTHICR